MLNEYDRYGVVFPGNFNFFVTWVMPMDTISEQKIQIKLSVFMFYSLAKFSTSRVIKYSFFVIHPISICPKLAALNFMDSFQNTI